MSVEQISVFVGCSRAIWLASSIFTQANVSVPGYSASDTGDYGMLRFVVDDPDKALEVLRDMNCAATKTPVLQCLRLEDKPGELARVVGVLSACNINVKYSYFAHLHVYFACT